MRICHIIEAAGGGSGQVMLDLARLGVEDGDDITVIYSPDRVDENFQNGLSALKGQIKSHPFLMKRAVGLHDARAALDLYKLLKSFEPFDVIHSHSSKAGALSRIAGILLPGKQVYTPHAFMTLAPNASPLYGWIERLLSYFGSAIICVSEDERVHARDHLKISGKKLFVIPNGVSLNYPVTREASRTELGVSTKNYVVGFIGRLVDQKCPVRLIESFAVAYAQNENLRLVIIGEGPLRGDVEAAIADKELTKVVQLLGRKNGRDYLPGFDCLLCCSDYEGFPVVFLESLAAGVPVISTPVGGAQDTIGKDEAGILISSFAAEDIGHTITKLSSLSPDAQAALRAKSLERANSFSLTLLQKRTRHLYNRLRRC